MSLGKTRKIVNVMLFVIFILFAAFQLNDPDPVIWVSVYAVVAIFSLMSSYGKMPKMIFLMSAIGLVAYALLHFSHFVNYVQIENKEELFGEMVYEKPYLEGTREFLGLLMGAAAMLYLWKQNKGN